MSSSDSDDDCYGNIAQKLQTIKNTYVKEKVESAILNDTIDITKTSETLSKTDEIPEEIIIDDCNITVNSTDNDEFTLDAIIAKNSKAQSKRGRGGKRKTTSVTSGPAEQEKRSTRRKTNNSNDGRTSPLDPSLITEPVKKKKAPARRKIAPVEEISGVIEQSSSSAISSRRGVPRGTAAARYSESSTTTRGRGGRTRGTSASRGSEPSARGRGSPARSRRARGRTRGMTTLVRGWGRRRNDLWSMFSAMIDGPSPENSCGYSSGDSSDNNYNLSNYPVYSVGNTDEYTDECDNQQLFSTRPVNNQIVIEETEILDDDNEEMSVKVYWQNLEVFKFKIRKYQKLTQIFDYFAQKEGVTNDKLLFMYNDRILKIDDSPDTINYSIAKFIDGGIVNQNVTHLVKKTRDNSNENIVNGLKIKFQCQNKKKPFETTLRPQDKLALSMMKCAEHLETPLERLKFYFDGDLITSKNTPEDLELEGGECIDVKICS